MTGARTLDNKTCAVCSAPSEPGDLFCTSCGAELTVVSVAEPSRDRGLLVPLMITVLIVVTGAIAALLIRNDPGPDLRTSQPSTTVPETTETVATTTPAVVSTASTSAITPTTTDGPAPTSTTSPPLTTVTSQEPPGPSPPVALRRIPIDGLWGFIDITGTVVVEPVYEIADEFSEGLAAVWMSDSWGYIDSTGAVAIEPTFADAWGFSDGLAVANVGSIATAPVESM